MYKDEFRGLLTDDLNEAKILLSGVPLDANASIGKGASLAPDRLRYLSQFFPPLTMDGDDISKCKIYDFGDIEYKEGMDIEDYFSLVQKTISSHLDFSKLNLFFGGDHSVAIPLQRSVFDLAKKLNKKIAIIHIDAHPDICDIYEDSKYSHACPIRRAIEYGYDTKDISLIGIRGFELQEVEYFKLHPEIDVFKASQINKDGTYKIIEHLKEKYKDYLIYLSYDVDANDPCYAPGTGTPEPFGVDSKDIIAIIKSIFKNLNVVAFDLVEIAPPLDSNDITSWLGLKSLYEVFKEILLKESK